MTKIRIIVGDKGNVDFNSPVEVSDKEKEQFIRLMKSLFAPSIIQEEKVDDFRDWRIGGDRVQYPRPWTAEEYEVLLRSHSIEEAVNKLGRSGMAIIVQDGLWRPEFFNWCQEKGKNPFEDETIKIIKEFMKEKHDEIVARRNKRKNLKKKKQEIKELYDDLDSWNSERKKRQIDLLYRLGQLKGMNVEDFIQTRKKEIYSKIEQLKKELDEQK